MNTHSAIGPALGYYYQAIFALISLLDSQNDNAYVSIETFDDVFHEDGTIKNLHQLKHKTTSNPKISIKDEDLWKTLKVWCDFIITNDPKEGIFTLSTVATIDISSPLNVLKTHNEDRSTLNSLLLEEAKRVIGEREKVRQENIQLIKKGEKEKSIPYESRYKGCDTFLALSPSNRQTLLNNTRINTSIFQISTAQSEVVNRIKRSTQPKNYISLAESIIAWWDREAVRSLTRERKECIYLSELQEFISKKNSELYNDGFTDDIDDLELPTPDISHTIHVEQLEIIDASSIQKKRSFNTELKARIQRGIWIKNNLSSASKLNKYDKNLIEEWSYKFDEIKEISNTISEEEKKQKGRNLLDWTHNEANSQVKNISQHYDNPDLIRGSYQMLSKDKSVGWHCDYNSLIKEDDED
jgi:hypothetical protein